MTRPTCTQMTQTKAHASDSLVDNALNTTIHADLCGPMFTQTPGRKRYILMLTTTPHRHLNVQLLRERKEAVQNVFNSINLADRNADIIVKRIHTDNALESVSMNRKLSKMCIKLTTTLAHIPTPNRVAERIKLTLKEKAKTM